MESSRRHIFADEFVILALGVEDAQDLVVLEESVKVEIGDDHLAGTEAATVNDVVGIHVDEASLGTRDYKAGIIERKTTGAQAVAVENGADLVAVSKCERGGAVPRFNAVAAVLKKRGGVAGIGRRHNHADRLADGAAVVGKQFYDFVKRSGIGSTLREHWIYIERQCCCAGFHACPVAPDGVDFAVVREGAEGLGALPRGQDVGGVPLMKEREWRLEFWIGEVGVELGKEASRAKRLVDHH